MPAIRDAITNVVNSGIEGAGLGETVDEGEASGDELVLGDVTLDVVGEGSAEVSGTIMFIGFMSG